MYYNYKGYTIKPFKNYYLIFDKNGNEVSNADNIEDAKHTINNILKGSF